MVVGCAGASAAMLAVYRHWRILPPASTLWRSAIVGMLAYGLAVLWLGAGLGLFVKLPLIGVIATLAYMALGEFSADEMVSIRSSLNYRPASV
jgi:hypothetical protein